MKKAFLLGVWFLPLTALIIFIGTTFVGGNTNSTLFQGVIDIDSKVKNRLLTEAGFSGSYVPSITRNSMGTKIYLEVVNLTNKEMSVLIVSTNKIEKKSLPGMSPIFDDQDQIICFITNQTLCFSNGSKIKFTVYDRFGFSPGGKFFFFCDSTNGTTVSRTEDPLKSLLILPPNFLPQSIFEQTNQIILFGRKENREKGGSIYGIVLSKGTPLSIVNQEIDLSLAGGVIDLAVSSDLLLVESKSDLFPVWFLVDIKTAKRERIGFAGEKGFFLANELGDRLKNGIRPTRVNSLGH